MSRTWLLVVLLVGLSLALQPLTPQEEFESFQRRYNKSYASPVEKAKRFQIFKDNLKRAKQMNEEHGAPYPFGVTKFSDLTAQEFQRLYLMREGTFSPPNLAVAKSRPAPATLPTTWDWGLNRTNIITPVNNQGQCGSCWAFSATEAIESVWALAHNGTQHEVPLSVQQIVDCDKTDSGCGGGWPYNAYEYVIKAGGLESAADYPYKARNGQCQFNSKDVVAKISSWEYVIKNSTLEDTTMLNFVATSAPVSVCVDASPWQLYSHGVLSKGCPNLMKDIDHCVQVTGFTTIGGVQAWRVRNSWGSDWGQDGYIYIERGLNLCAIANVVTIPVAAA